MNGKKIQANMQINVGFVANVSELFKQVESKFKQIDLTSSLFSGVTTGLDKNFKDIQSNLEKMLTGLGKRGLSAKQYENIFHGLNDNIVRAVDNVKLLGNELTKAFDSSKNKEMLRDLKEQQKLLEEIKDLSSKLKSSNTRAGTNARKALDNFGVDFGNKNMAGMLDELISRRAVGNKKLTPTMQGSVLGSLDQEGLRKVITLYKQYVEQLRNVSDLTKEIQQKSGLKGSNEEVVKGIQARIDKLEKETITQEELNALVREYERLSTQLNQGTTKLVKDFNTELTDTTENAEKLAKAGATLREIFAQFGIVFSAATVVRGFKQLVKTSFEFYRSLDSALNQIYVVSNLTSKAVNDLTGNFIHMAKETGMSIDDVTRAAVLFYQQGLNTDEVMEMTKVTAQFAKVAGIDATDAADKLTAAVNGYRLSAEDAMSVADKFNKVAAASAADINELSTAFSKAAAQANQAGVSMDNYLAYIATMEEATREAPENLGTSLKTIFSRMQQVNSGEADDGTDINKVETALKNVGIALRDTRGQLRDLEEIFAELGPMWDTLDRNTQAYLGTIIAGTRQQSRFITLMQNWDRVLELSEESANSAGQQALMHAKAMESIVSKMQQFKVAWQEFVSNISDSSLFKGLIDIGTKFIDMINSGTRPVSILASGMAILAANSKDVFTSLGKNIQNGWDKLIMPFTAMSPQQQNEKRNLWSNQLQEQQNITHQLEARVAFEGESDFLNKEILKSKREESKIQEKLVKLEKASTMSIKEKVGQMATTAGILIGIVGTTLGAVDENLSGVVTTVGSVISALGMAFAGNPAGAVVAFAAACFQLYQVINKWDDNKLKKIEDSINNINQALVDYNNQNTKIRNSQQLIDKYEELNGKLYRTNEEQEQLNKVIQQLGDTHGIDVITDAYGNLRINIQAVREELVNWELERDELLTKLQTAEDSNILKATTGGISLEEALQRSLSNNSSEYRTLLMGFSNGLISAAGDTGKSMAQALSANLKNEIMVELKNNSLDYAAEGLGTAALRLNREINEAFSDSPEALTELYSKVEYLQKNIDNMTFADAQNYLQSYWEEWHEQLHLTQEEWRILTNTINNTVFDASNINNFINQARDNQNKMSSKGWEETLKKQRETLKKYYEEYNEAVGAINGADHDRWGVASGPTVEKFIKEVEQGQKTNYGSGWKDIFRLKKGDQAGDKLDLAVKSYQETLKKREEFLQKYAEENDLADIDEAYRQIVAMNTIADVLENQSADTLQYLNKIGSLYNTDDLKGKFKQEYADTLMTVMGDINNLGPGASDADKYNIFALFYEKNKDEMSDKVREQWEAILQDAYDGLQMPSHKTLAQVGQELDSLSGSLRSMNSLVASLKENGGLALDDFIELGGIIDSMDLSTIATLGEQAVTDYIDALDKLDLAFDENTGYITMNAQAITSLQQIQEAQVKARIKGMADDLRATAAAEETKLKYVEAQITATEHVIENVKNEAEGYDTAEGIKSAATAEFQDLFDKSITKIQGEYKTDLQNQGEWTSAVLKNLDTLGKAWAKYYKGLRDHSITDLSSIKAEAEKVTKEAEWSAVEDTSGIDWSNYEKIDNQEKRDALVQELNNYLTTLKASRDDIQSTLSFTQKQISLLDRLAAPGTNLSKLGAESGSSSKNLKDYVGKLKEIYNILNRIALLEHRESMLDSYASIEEEELYGKHLKERISINEELLDQYDFLVREQKQWTNGYKEFIEQSSVADVFDFDEFGQIIINFERYNELTTQAADGMKSEKEQADELYSTYTNMYDELEEDANNYIKTLQKAIDYQREVYDAYVETEHDLANAIKEIYQQILDDKLAAIDKEKEALDELREARARANKEQKDSKEVAGIQSDIQRAMMDTSGASASALIKSQDRLDEKLEAIAEDKYSEMLDDIIERLDEEKESLQQEFDDMFEDLTALFDWMETSVMSDKNGITAILSQTKEWRQQTEAEHMEEIDLWNTRFEKYTTEITGEEGRTITDVVKHIDELQAKTAKIDEALREQNAKWGTEIAAAISNGIQSAYNAGAAGAGGGGGYNNPYLSNVPPGDTPTPTTPKISKVLHLGDEGYKITTTTDAFQDYIGKTVEIKPEDGYIRAYNADGKSRVYVNDPVGYDPNVKIKEIGKGTDGNYYVKISDFTTGILGTGDKIKGDWWYPIKQFTKGGFGFIGGNRIYANGGFARFTGPAWLDGTPSQPEAVLDALQTKHFVQFTNALDQMYNNQPSTGMGNSIVIDTISFNVESMSSPEDGEKAFSMFVNKFNEIGNQTGIKFNNFKNTL